MLIKDVHRKLWPNLSHMPIAEPRTMARGMGCPVRPDLDPEARQKWNQPHVKHEEQNSSLKKKKERERFLKQKIAEGNLGAQNTEGWVEGIKGAQEK